MVKVKVIKDLKSSIGEIKAGEICVAEKVWLNNICNDIYIKLIGSKSDVEIITSISSIEIIEKNNYIK